MKAIAIYFTGRSVERGALLKGKDLHFNSQTLAEVNLQEYFVLYLKQKGTPLQSFQPVQIRSRGLSASPANDRKLKEMFLLGSSACMFVYTQYVCLYMHVCGKLNVSVHRGQRTN